MMAAYTASWCELRQRISLNPMVDAVAAWGSGSGGASPGRVIRRAVPRLVAGGAVYCVLWVDLYAAGGAVGASRHTGPAGGDVVGPVCGGPAWGGAVAAHPAGLCRACGHAGRAGTAHLGRQVKVAATELWAGGRAAAARPAIRPDLDGTRLLLCGRATTSSAVGRSCGSPPILIRPFFSICVT